MNIKNQAGGDDAKNYRKQEILPYFPSSNQPYFVSDNYDYENNVITYHKLNELENDSSLVIYLKNFNGKFGNIEQRAIRFENSVNFDNYMNDYPLFFKKFNNGTFILSEKLQNKLGYYNN